MNSDITEFIKILKHNKDKLTLQQFRTIKGQAREGDVTGARKGLYKLLEGRCQG